MVRANRDTSARSWQNKRVKGEGKGGGAASVGPVVEHVAFSSNGKVGSDTQQHRSFVLFV